MKMTPSFYLKVGRQGFHRRSRHIRSQMKFLSGKKFKLFGFGGHLHSIKQTNHTSFLRNGGKSFRDSDY